MSKAQSYDPGPQIAHAGGINIGTKNLDVSLKFFRDLLGMEVTAQEDGVAYLRGYQELTHHSLTLTQQADKTINTLSFRVARREDVELFSNQLLQEEVEVKYLAAGTETGRGEAIRFLIPGGKHPVELYYDMEKPQAPEELRSQLLGNSSRRRGLGVQRLDHLNVMTSPGTVNQAEGFLRNSLGFKRRESLNFAEYPEMLLASWLSCNSKMHDIAIGANMTEEDAQFHHVAFSIENFNDMLTAADQIRDLPIQIDAGPGKHGIGQAMYLYMRDPGSGHRIELYSGGTPIFDPDWQPLSWLTDHPHGMTWYGDLPDINPETSTYLETTGTAGMEF